MMKKLLPTIPLLLAGQLAADEHFDRGVLRVLNEANQQTLVRYDRDLCQPLIASAGPVPGNSSTKEMNECVIALCGTPSENKSVFITDANFGQYISPEIKKQISVLEPNYKKILDNEKQTKLKKLEKMQSLLKQPDPEKWSPEFRAKMSYKLFSPYLKENIDLKKPYSDRYVVELKNDKHLPPEFKKQLLDYKDRYENFIKNDINSFMERGLYSDDEQKQIAKDRLAKMQKVYESVVPSLGKFEKRNYGERLKELQEDFNKMDEGEIDIYLINLSTLEEQILSHTPSGNLQGQKPSCEKSQFCNNALVSFIKNSKLTSAVEEAKKEITSPQNQGRLMNQCLAQIVVKLSDSSDRIAADKLVADVKRVMNQNVFAKFSPHSRKLLEAYFQKKIVTSNKSLNTAIGATSSFEDLRQYTENELKNNYEPLPMTEEAAVTNALELADGTNDYSGTEACAPNLGSNAFDAYMAYANIKTLSKEEREIVAKKIPPKDHIFISPFTCHHELRGRSVVAHELGHAINHIFASQKFSAESTRFYKNLRQCSTDNYVEFVPDRTFLSQENDGEKTEEDTADIFAYMAYTDQSDLFSCALIKPTLNNQGYDDLSFNAEDGDPHSTPLYRLIMEAINKNKQLPISCQRALGPLKAELRLKKCVP